MINLSSLSALIRTIRHTTGIDGPASPVARVSSITAVAEDDAGAMSSTPLRPSLWARTPLELLETVTSPRDADLRREAPAPATRLAAAPPSAYLAPAPPVPAADVESAALDLTATARVLQAALRGTGLKAPVPPTITSPLPLVTEPHSLPPELARGLATAVAQSGLFYESHLARTLRRDYPIAALSREPQAAWPAIVADASTTSAAASALPEGQSALLTRQLDVLDTRSLVWNGDVWPGQRASIALEEESERDAAADDADDVRPSSSWSTRIAIDLPSLGRVEATLRLHGGALDIVLAASSEPTLARLTAAKVALAASLGDAQVAVGRFDVGLSPVA